MPDWIDLEEAWSRLEREVPALATEEVRLPQASGRVLATTVRTDRDYPPFDRAAMDGFAVRSEDVAAATQNHAVELDVVGEATPGKPHATTETARGAAPGAARVALRIMTGAAVPAGWDSVVPVESTSGFDTQPVRVFASTRPGQNVASRGIERRAGEVLFDAGCRLAAVDIGILAMAGVARVPVAKRPRVAVLSTGDELVPFDAHPGPAQIRNSNTPMLAAQVASDGEVEVLGSVADSRRQTTEAVRRGLDHDLLLITGGVSMGAYDWVGAALDEADVQVHFRRVALQPGKPVLFGTHAAGIVLALPGNPVSAYTTFRLFARPALRLLQGASEVRPLWLRAAAQFEWQRRTPKAILFPGRVSDTGATVTRVPYTGSGDLMAYARANCQIVLPPAIERVRVGTPVPVWPLDASSRLGAGAPSL